MNTILELRNISKSFDSKSVISNLSLTLSPGSIGCLLGASGCGKTTTLRTVAGFETPDKGQILIKDRLIADSNSGVPPEKGGSVWFFRIMHYFLIFPSGKMSGSDYGSQLTIQRLAG